MSTVSECFFGACLDAAWFALAEVACDGFAGFCVYGDAAVWAGLYAPVAAFAFLFIDD